MLQTRPSAEGLRGRARGRERGGCGVREGAGQRAAWGPGGGSAHFNGLQRRAAAAHVAAPEAAAGEVHGDQGDEPQRGGKGNGGEARGAQQLGLHVGVVDARKKEGRGGADGRKKGGLKEAHGKNSGAGVGERASALVWLRASRRSHRRRDQVQIRTMATSGGRHFCLAAAAAATLAAGAAGGGAAARELVDEGVGGGAARTLLEKLNCSWASAH